MSADNAAAHDDGHDHGHGAHHPVEYYYKTYAALVVLFLVSVIGPYIGEITGMWWLTLITAFGIAFVKAGLVIRNFMHLTVEKAFVHYFLITSLAFMLLFFFAVSPDVRNHEGTNWKNLAAEAEIERALAEAEAGGGHHGGHGDAHGADHGDEGHGDDGHDDGGHH
jgi:caa(3)-type oxidase subunit IV